MIDPETPDTSPPLPKGAHEDVLRWLSRDLDGELSERERILLSDHLDGCPPCEQVARQLRSAERALAEDAAVHPPVGLVERILARIDRGGVAAPALETSQPAMAHAAAVRTLRPLVSLKWSAALAAGLLALVTSVHLARAPKLAVASTTREFAGSDPALKRVLERWQRGRAAPPSFFELLLAPSSSKAGK
jgi:anti-sigma factor RsiW